MQPVRRGYTWIASVNLSRKGLRSYSGSWSSFAAHIRCGRNCRRRSGRLRLSWPAKHGIYPVAHPLRLDYVGLKRRLGGTVGNRPKKARSAFVELVAAAPSRPEECVIELESCGGSKTRIQWKTAGPPDWTSLLRAWRDAAR